MSFRDDVDSAVGQGSFRNGLRAVTVADKTRIGIRRKSSLRGSANVDEALVDLFPNDSRWDYLIGQEDGGTIRIHWIEIHPAGNATNIREVENKLAWLGVWLKTTTLAQYPRTIVWVASGRSGFTARDPRLRRLAKLGCAFVGGYIRL